MFQCVIIFICVFLGEKFFFDIIGQRQIRTGDIVVCGRKTCDYDRDDWDGEYSVHYTYNFNIFVFLQYFNFLNARILDDRFNVFYNIHKSHYFLVIMLIILVLQILFLTFLGPAIRVVTWGLDPLSWLFCIAIGMLGLIWSVVLKLIPLEKILPGGGKEEISIEELGRLNTIALKKPHTKKFFKG